MTGLPNKPKLLPLTLAEYIMRAARARRFAQDIRDCRVLLQPKRRFHRQKPAPFIAPSPDPYDEDDD